MSLCIMHLLQIAPAWKKQFLQGHIHCTWNQTSDSQLTSMQALADADIELENASTWGRIAALPGNCRFHLIENEVFWRLLAVDGANAWHRQDTSQLPQVTNRKSSLLSSPLHQSFVCSLSSFVFWKKNFLHFFTKEIAAWKSQSTWVLQVPFSEAPGASSTSRLPPDSKNSIEVLKSWSLGWTELNCVFWGISKLSKVLS